MSEEAVKEALSDKLPPSVVDQIIDISKPKKYYHPGFIEFTRVETARSLSYGTPGELGYR